MGALPSLENKMIRENNRIYLEDSDFELEIGEMKIGESGWAVPWALGADSADRLYLRRDYTIHKRPGGTVSMQVVRKSDSTWCVDIPSDYKFSRGSDPNSVWDVIYDLEVV